MADSNIVDTTADAVGAAPGTVSGSVAAASGVTTGAAGVARTASGASSGEIQVDSAMSIFAALLRDTARAWSTQERQTETAVIKSGVATPVANCAAAAVVSQSARSTASAFSTASELTKENDKNFTDFLRHYAESTEELGADHGLRVSSSDYSFQV